MRIVTSTQKFAFNYTAYDQSPSLYVAFSIYNVTTGSAVFVQKVNATYAGFGSYTGTFTGLLSATYLIIGVVYTDNTYSTPDTSRPPTADTYQVVSGGITYFAFAYATYDQATGLSIQGTVYDVTTGSPVLSSNPSFTYVAFGVYFATFTASLGHTYDALGIVYTDGTFVTPDNTRAPSSDEFDSFTAGGGTTFILPTATLVGQSLIATLEEA